MLVKRSFLHFYLLLFGLVSFFIVGIAANVVAAKFPVTWEPKKISLTVERGSSATVDVSFASKEDLADVTLWQVPEIQPYISLEQTEFPEVIAGNTYTTRLQISASCGDSSGTYDGTVHLKVGTRTYPATLKVDLNIVDPPSSPSHIVEFPVAEPDAFFVGSGQLVRFTAQVVPDFALLFENIHLFKIDTASGTDLGRMYDDGTHGDLLAGDSTFTTEVFIPGDVPASHTYQVSVPYSDTNCPILSQPIAVNVLENPDPEEVNAALTTMQAVSDQIDGLVQSVGLDDVRIQLLQMLQADPDVEQAGISEDDQSIWIVFVGSLKGTLLLSPDGTWGYPSTNTAIVFSPFSSLGESELVHVHSRLDQDTCMVPQPIKRDAQVTVNFLKSLPSYGVISIATHGGINGDGDVAFLSGEQASTFLGIPTSHLIDWMLGRIAIGNDNAWVINPSFITHYARNKKYPDSIIFLSMCHSLDNTTLSDAFISNGAGTIFGWQHSVSITFSRETKENLLIEMIDNGLDTANAYSAVPHVDPYTTPHANLLMEGRGDLKLPVNLVSNGSFETATFADWNLGFQYGCDFPGYGTPSGYTTVISQHATDGNYAARLGRWDQVYTGGIYGPPDPGTEPCGADFISQDIDIPAGSISLTLSFDYNMETYDTSAWDWFDVFIRDPATNDVIGTVVSRDGKPGYDYGEYWSSGTKSVTYDVSGYAGQTIRLWFGNQQDGYGDQNGVWIDNIQINCQ